MSPTDLSQLLSLLSQREWDDAALEQAAQEVLDAPDNPDLDWIEDPSLAMAYMTYDLVRDYAAESDKVDELHEQFEEIIGEPVPPFPYDDPEVQQSSIAYFRWLDEVLARLGPDVGGYAVVEVPLGLDDNLHLVVVHRRDLAAVIALADKLGLPITYPMGTGPNGA